MERYEPKANILIFPRTFKVNYTQVVYTTLSTSLYNKITFRHQIKQKITTNLVVITNALIRLLLSTQLIGNLLNTIRGANIELSICRCRHAVHDATSGLPAAQAHCDRQVRFIYISVAYLTLSI